MEGFFLVAEYLFSTLPPLVCDKMLYYDIKLHIFVLYYSLNNGLFFWKWYGLGLNQKCSIPVKKLFFSPFLDDTRSQCVSNPL